MSGDFLAENNNCGQSLLRLVARGNAIIAELFRLSDYIPAAFRAGAANKYTEVLFNFSYLSNQAYYENAIMAKAELQALDDELKFNHLDILNRFYLAFESIHKYASDLCRFLEDLDEGIYIQQNVDSILLNADGKQLLVEALYLYGLMLLIVDIKFEGSVREHMLVGYIRYSSQRSYMNSNVDDVCKLLRSTGYRPHAAAKPANYPESFFARFPINAQIIGQCIGRLRTDDLYNQYSVYPQPEHRSHALANQAAMLYVLLYFRADILHSEAAMMREIVDKFFPDNWVLSIYMGSLIVNLADAWDGYKSARSALANTLATINIRQHATLHARRLAECTAEVRANLNEGFLTHDYLLVNANKVFTLLRQANCTLKWSILHTSNTGTSTDTNEMGKRLRAIRDQVHKDFQFDANKVLDLLLNLSQLEFNVRELCRAMIERKQEQWETLKREATERTAELAEVFGGEKPLTRIARNDNLQRWFTQISAKIGALSYEATGATSAGRDITQLVSAVQEVLHFHEIDKNLQVRQFVQDTANFLTQMINTCNIREDSLVQLALVGDFSYALQLIDTFTVEMQTIIKNKPSLVTKLRATFLKLAVALDSPLMRITQANSSDFSSVTQYYSREMVSYVRKVLQIIPVSMFTLLAEIIDIQTNKLREVPTLLDKEKLREYAQLDERYKIANRTFSISLYTEGILQMKSAQIGCINVDSKQLLEDGIRKELVLKIVEALHTQLQFNARTSHHELYARLDKLAEQIDGFRRSFEYIQDYVNIYGLKIWQEEFSRIIYYHVEQECNTFVKKKVFDYESIYQSKNIPIPIFPPIASSSSSSSSSSGGGGGSAGVIGEMSVNFIGRLAREMLRITDPRTTYYIEKRTAWYDLKTREEIVNLRLFKKLEQTLNSFGLHGLDRLFSFMITRELQTLLVALGKNEALVVDTYKNALQQMLPLDTVSNLNAKFYTQIASKLGRLFASNVDPIMRIGQMQLLRKKICYELNNAAKFDSKHLFHALATFNKSLVSQVNAHFDAPGTHPYPADEDNPLLFELNPYLECVGISEPFKKIYLKTNKCEHIAFYSAMLVIGQLAKLPSVKLTVPVFKGSSTTLNATNIPMVNVTLTNAVCLVIGCITLLKQFHTDFRNQFIAILGQYVRSCMMLSGTQRLSELPADANKVIEFVEEFLDLTHLNREILETYIPKYIVDQCQTLTS